MTHKTFQAVLYPTIGLLFFVSFEPGTAGAVDYFWTGGTSSWNNTGNWDQGLSPEGYYEEVGIINNGGVATLNTVANNSTPFVDPNLGVIPGSVAGLILGQSSGESGTLQVQSGGVINFVDSSGTPDGTVNIGLGGTGVLEVQGGGSFSSTYLDVNAGSKVIIGSGAGSATVAVGNTTWLNGTTTVYGAGHTISTTGDVYFEGQSVYKPVISANGSGGISTISTSGNLNLQGGELRVAFSGGYTPSYGDSWDLADAANVTGAMGTIRVPTGTPGQVYRLNTVAGGTNGTLLQLDVDVALQLTYDWDTDSLSISSPSGVPIDIDGYSILSNGGALDSNHWNSLQNQAVSGWFEAFPTSTALNELNGNAGGSLSVGVSPIDMGTPFTPVIGAFGTPVEGLEFEYTSPGGGVVQGLVEYTGDRIFNNLLLTIDPSTGEAQLKNSSLTSISIDGYSILSDSGALLAGNSYWSSLEDQNKGYWVEASPTSTELSELNPYGSTTLLPGQGFSLGNLYDPNNEEQDLELEFLMVGQPGTQTGTVHFGSIVPFSTDDADFDGDGKVDGLDFLALQRGFGITSGATLADGDANSDGAVNGADVVIWENQYGTSSLGEAVTAVPEPSSSALFLLAIGVAAFRARR